MKNFYLKFMSCVVIIFCIGMPLFGMAKIMSKPSWAKYESATTIISEENDTFSEINNEEDTTNKINMYISFEERLEKVKTKGNLNHVFSSESEITEIQVIEDETTKPKETEKQTTLITTTIAKQVTTTHLKTTKPKTEKIELVTELVTEPPTTKTSYVSSEKYSTAAIIWNYLRNLGYSKVVCAGILGNMMAEVGGNTLDLQPYLYGGSYYGICQWSLYYNPNIAGASLESQLNFLANSIKSEIDMFGYKYYSGFDYNAFLRLTDIEDIALSFAMCYERCASWAYSVRVSNAYAAYDYFA